MRVVLDARCLGERNTSNRTYWSELVQALGRFPDLELLLLSNAPLSAMDVPTNGRAIVVPGSDRGFSLFTLPKLASAHRADVVHVQYTVSPFFRVPVVTTIHDVSYFVEPNWFGLKDRTILRRTVPAACRRAARVLAPSETCREEILSFIDVAPEKVRVTLEGTPNRLGSVPEDSLGLEAVAVKNPFVLLVGGASPRKNLPGAIEAVREARRGLPDLRLLVTGALSSKPDEAWVLAPGPLSDGVLAAAYRRAHALLHPSFHEGFGLTLLEAMAFGCPVVASDRGAIPEIAGSAASLFDVEDTEGMARALVDLFNPVKRETMTEEGLRRAASFTWAETARATVEAYREAVAPTHRPE